MSFFNNIAESLKNKNIIFIHTDVVRSINSLHKDEVRIVSSSVLKRQEEFATGRWCARKALEKSGYSGFAVLSNGNREPIWPKGICGSISHTKGAYCCAVAKNNEYRSIGIDIENANRKISEGALKIILNDDEMDWTSKKEDMYKRIIFCIKESVFKLLYPLIKDHFYFSSVSVLPVKSNNEFEFVLNKDLNKEFKTGNTYKGLYYYNDDLIFTIVYI